MNADIQQLFLQMIGGDEEIFFRTHWRTRTCFVESAVPEFRSLYRVSDFLEDYKRFDFHKPTLFVSVDDEGKRAMFPADEKSSIDEALDRGMSVVLQSLLLPKNVSGIPERWTRFINLHSALSNYLLPGFPSLGQLCGAVAAVDIFCTSSSTSTGGHYDTGDVFYFALDGEKEWTVELRPDLDKGLQLAAEGTTSDRPPLGEHMKIRVRPGDCLYVPPYTYHRVQSFGSTLALSLGLPTFTEINLFRYTLNRMLRERKPYGPLPSFPKTQGMLFSEARAETRRRILDAIGFSARPAVAAPVVPNPELTYTKSNPGCE